MAERKYMFDLDFDHPGGAPVAAPAEDDQETAQEEVVEEPPPPTFSEEELTLARGLAFEEGREAGHTEAVETTERLTANALGTLSQQMEGLFKRQEEANDANARAAVRVAMAVLKKMLPAACEQHAFDEVTRVVEEVIGHVLDEPRIIVRVAEHLVDPVRERLDQVAEAHGFEGRVVVQADNRLEGSDCRVEWTDGGAERDEKRLLAEIEANVERALAPPEQRIEVVHEEAEA